MGDESIRRGFCSNIINSDVSFGFWPIKWLTIRVLGQRIKPEENKSENQLMDYRCGCYFRSQKKQNEIGF